SPTTYEPANYARNQVEYDAVGRPERLIYPDGTEEVTSYGFEEVTLPSKTVVMSSVIMANPRSERETLKDLDGKVRLIREHNLNSAGQPEIYQTSFEYDKSGNLKKLTDHLGNTTTWVSNGLGQNLLEVNPDRSNCVNPQTGQRD